MPPKVSMPIFACDLPTHRASRALAYYAKGPPCPPYFDCLDCQSVVRNRLHALSRSTDRYTPLLADTRYTNSLCALCHSCSLSKKSLNSRVRRSDRIAGPTFLPPRNPAGQVPMSLSRTSRACMVCSIVQTSKVRSSSFVLLSSCC